MATAAAPHRYRITATFGPPELFAVLRNIAESPRRKDHAPEFEFEWLKRRVAVSATTEAAAAEMLDELLAVVGRLAGPGLMLPGQPQTGREGRFIFPVGVLIQTPDIYLEILVRTLTELGIKGVVVDDDGQGLSIPVSTRNMALGYTQMIASFPLPAYLVVEDLGAPGSSLA